MVPLTIRVRIGPPRVLIRPAAAGAGDALADIVAPRGRVRAAGERRAACAHERKGAAARGSRRGAPRRRKKGQMAPMCRPTPARMPSFTTHPNAVTPTAARAATRAASRAPGAGVERGSRQDRRAPSRGPGGHRGRGVNGWTWVPPAGRVSLGRCRGGRMTSVRMTHPAPHRTAPGVDRRVARGGTRCARAPVWRSTVRAVSPWAGRGGSPPATRRPRGRGRQAPRAARRPAARRGRQREDGQPCAERRHPPGMPGQPGHGGDDGGHRPRDQSRQRRQPEQAPASPAPP